MLLNNLDPEVAERPEDLVVYGGSGQGGAESTRRCGRSSRSLLELGDDETLLVQSGKPVGVFRTHAGAPRVLIANAMLVPRWATWDEFRRLEALGPDDVRADDRGLVDLHRHAGDPAGHVPDVRGGGREALRLAGPRRRARSSPPGSAGWAARSRSPGRWPAPRSSASRSIRLGSSGGSRRATSTRRPSRSTTRSRDPGRVGTRARALSVGLLGNAADVVPELARRGEHFDLVTDQTAAHDPLTGYVPRRSHRSTTAAALRASDPDEYLRSRACRLCATSEALLEFVRRGSYVFDYGNNLRGEAREGGVAEAFSYPGFVPAYIRPLFCRGVGPFRWAVLSGEPADIAAIDAGAAASSFPDDPLLQRWLELAPERVAFQGLPARICWLGYGDRAKAGLAINELVRSGEVKAPVVIGRDHLDSGSVASPYRETGGHARRL